MALDLSALDGGLDSDGPQQTIDVAPRAPLSSFEEDPNNPRVEFDDPEFEDFVEDIKERGILQPIVVQRLPNDKFLIRFGARRFRAACRLKFHDAPYIVTEDVRQFDDYAQVSENERRKGLQPLELAKFVARKLAIGDKKKVIASRIKVDPSAVTHLLALVEGVPDFILELYHSRKCRSPQYLYELRKLHDQNAELVERRCADADEIDRRLLSMIAGEINFSADKPSLDKSKTVAELFDDINCEFKGRVASEKTVQIVGAERRQSSPHDQALEKELGKPNVPEEIKKPLLLGTYQDRRVMIMLSQRPTEPGRAVIRFEDGSGTEEVFIAEIALTMLSDSKA